MELRQLRYFVALAEHRHFGKAAEALHISQPSLSQQIRALEADVGTVLVDRTRRRVALTPDGEALLSYARRLLALAEDAQSDLADRIRLRRGRVRLGATPTVGGHILPAALREFQETYPGLELIIMQAGSGPLSRRLEAGELELALIVRDGGTGPDPFGRCSEADDFFHSGVHNRDHSGDQSPGADPSLTGLNFEPLYDESIVLAVPAGHPFAARSSVPVPELRGERWILSEEGFHLRELAVRACRDAGFEPFAAVSGADVDASLRFVRAGLGIALAPVHAARAYSGIVLTRLEPELKRTVGLAWPLERYLPRAARALREFLRERCAPSAFE